MDPYQLEAAPVCSKNLVTSQLEDSSLPELGPSLQVSGPMSLAEVADLVYDTVLQDEVRPLLALWDPCLVEVHVQVPKDNGVPEALQYLLQVRQVIHF